jgi:hypothetical protein
MLTFLSALRAVDILSILTLVILIQGTELTGYAYRSPGLAGSLATPGPQGG